MINPFSPKHPPSTEHFVNRADIIEAKGDDKMESKKIYSSFSDKTSTSSFVGKTLIRDCLLSPLSSDQTEQLNFSANAKYSTSFGSGEISPASAKNSLYFIARRNLILGISSNKNEKRSSSFNPDFCSISSLCFQNSSKINSGDISSSLSSKNRFNVLPLAIIAANNSLASTTSNIYSKPVFFNSSNLPSLSFLPNSTASFSVNLLFEAIALRAVNLSTSDVTNSVTALDTSRCNSFISFSSTAGISTFNSAILTIYDNINQNKLINIFEA